MAVQKSKSHKAAKKGLHHHTTTRGSDKKNARPRKFAVLRDCFPNAGLRYPFAGTVTNQTRRDKRIAASLNKHVPRMRINTVEPEVALVFERATDFVLSRVHDFGTDPVKFMEELQGRPEMPPWVPKMYVNVFMALVLSLRAARLNWYDTPRQPYNIEQHCTLAKSIDKFLQSAATTLVWGGEDSELTGWFRRGGMTSEHNGLDDPAKLDELADHLHFEDADNVDDTAMELDDDDVAHPSPAADSGAAPPTLDVLDTDGVEISDKHFMAIMEKLHLTIRLKNPAESTSMPSSLGADSTPIVDKLDVKEDVEDEMEKVKKDDKMMDA
ncbi:hypothetical protein B0T19DRAFT_453614 [Cercophora scortea]|uniref:Uncharacterized protein n=1 Tax=Cercophora scortea TaxID=314031 RepID=A0AAE0MKU6_9PEZI|nr:hypothetical protein B0T19DRAFT_453614 [Cercophora scortea]